MLIGITGGFGAGKSFVTERLAELLSARVFSSDQICRELLEPDQAGYREVVTLWGKRFLARNGAIDRVLLRDTVFHDTRVRTRLEAILHPLVRERLNEARRNSAPDTFIIAEVPLLYEVGWQDDFDWIISVYVPVELSERRTKKRDGISAEAARAVIATQISAEEKRDRADSVIDNSQGRVVTEKQIRELAEFLRLRAGSAPSHEEKH